MVTSFNYAQDAIKGYKTSNLASSEKNDCFVRAMAAATGSAYDTAHGFVKDNFSRENGKGTENVAIFCAMDKFEKNGMEIAGKKFDVEVLGTEKLTNTYKLYGEEVKRKKTLKSFIKSNPKGTFIVTVAKHAFTVKDGVLIDNVGEEFRPTRKVQGAYRLDEVGSSEAVQLSLF